MVQYVKLSTGEELIVADVRYHSDFAELANPLVIENISSEGYRYIALQRYSPYTERQLIDIERHSLVFAGNVLPDVAALYEASVKYITRHRDPTFIEGIATTAKKIASLAEVDMTFNGSKEENTAIGDEEPPVLKKRH